MSVFIEPGSDTSEPGLPRLLSLWDALAPWRRNQLLDRFGIDYGARYPLSELLAIASVAELIIEIRSVAGHGVQDFADASTGLFRPSDRHVVLEWPPRGQLALIWQYMRSRTSRPV